MTSDESSLPTEQDFLAPRSRNLDERHALKVFGGKTPEQAEAMFRRNFSFYQEDLTYMRGPAFRFYMVPAMRYLTSDAAVGDPDAASTFCSLLELRLGDDPAALVPIAPLVIATVERVLRHFDQYGCSPEIYGDVPGRYRAVVARLGG